MQILTKLCDGFLPKGKIFDRTGVRDIISGLGLKWVRQHQSQPTPPLCLILNPGLRKILTTGINKKKKLIRLCNDVWPQYELGRQEKWPLNGSLSYDTILQLDLYCRRKSTWSEASICSHFHGFIFRKMRPKRNVRYV